MSKSSDRRTVEKVLRQLAGFDVKVEIDYRTYDVLIVQASGQIRTKVRSFE